MERFFSLATSRRMVVVTGLTLGYLILLFWVTFDYWVYLFHLIPLSFNQQTVWFEPQEYERLILRSFLLSLLYVFCICLTFSTERTVVGAWLTALYVICVSLVVFSLSTHLFQVDINALEVGKEGDKAVYISHECDADSIKLPTTGSVVSVDCIVRDDVSAKSKQYYLPAEVAGKYSTWKSRKLHLEALANNTDRKEKIEQLLNIEKNDTGKTSDLKKELLVVDEAIKSLAERTRLPGGVGNKSPDLMSIDELKEEIKKLKKELSLDKDKSTTGNGTGDHEKSTSQDEGADLNYFAELKKEIAQIKISLVLGKARSTTGDGAAVENNSTRANDTGASDEPNDSEKVKKQLIRELGELMFDVGDRANEDKSRVRDKDRTPENVLFAQIESFEDFFWIFSQIFGIEYYWKVPKPILNINLILFMGILGSLIFVSIEFIKIPKGQIDGQSDVNYTMYFVRPFLGMIIALAMYVMVNSGLSVFPGSAEEKLSPFLLSFLGIISGMLAERAYQQLADTGAKAIGISNVKKAENEAFPGYFYSSAHKPTMSYYYTDSISVEFADKKVKNNAGKP